jgi:hypothetical protein
MNIDFLNEKQINSIYPFLLKVAQINYVSRNQLHCTANLNFGLMYKKGKTLLGFVNKLFISVHLIFFLDQVLLLAELAKKFRLSTSK